ncbi:MAG: AEC family transporter [Sphaerochaetaceae bacterium]|nr:AEC family transporter [Sphaerochaetaceae bacterium]
MAFAIVLKSIFTMISFMAMGYVLVKAKVADSRHAKSLSAFLIYCGTPGMFIASFQEMEYNSAVNLSLVKFFLLSLGIQVLMFAILFLLFGKRMSDGKYRILSIGAFMGNVGFFGQPLILSLFPDNPEASCYCMMFALSMNILVFTLGEFLISGDRRYVTVKRAIINPTVLAALVAIPMYVLQIKLPQSVFNITYLLRTMNGPVCMLILGFRLASMSTGEVFGEPFAYLTSALKLIIFPLITYAVLYFIPSLDTVFKVTMVISAGTPCASVILALAELHDCESKRAAYSVLLSAVICIITLPLLTLMFR